MRKYVLLALLTVAVAFVPTMAQQTSDTTVNMTMPSFLILYFRPAVTFNIQATDLESLYGNGPVSEGGSISANGFDIDATVDGGVTAGTFPTTDPKGIVRNFWAVRSISANGTQVSVSITDGAIDHATVAGATIGISNPETQSTNLDPQTWATSVSFNSTGLGAGAVELGDVRFDVDMSGATVDGSYTGGTVRVTAQNL